MIMLDSMDDSMITYIWLKFNAEMTEDWMFHYLHRNDILSKYQNQF